MTSFRFAVCKWSQVIGCGVSITDARVALAGKIDKIDHKEKANSATIYFEKLSAAKTALMLNGEPADPGPKRSKGPMTTAS